MVCVVSESEFGVGRTRRNRAAFAAGGLGYWIGEGTYSHQTVTGSWRCSELLYHQLSNVPEPCNASSGCCYCTDECTRAVWEISIRQADPQRGSEYGGMWLIDKMAWYTD